MIRIVPCIITLMMVMRRSANSDECARNFSLNKISMTKPAFRLCIETLSITQQIYMSLKKPVFYLVIRKQLSTFAAVLLRKLLWEDIDNENNTKVWFEARGARENFIILRRICENSDSLRNICDRK